MHEGSVPKHAAVLVSLKRHQTTPRLVMIPSADLVSYKAMSTILSRDICLPSPRPLFGASEKSE